MKKLTLLFAFTMIGLGLFAQAFVKQGAGVTIIVHGWDPAAREPAWMTSMANAIIARSGGVGQVGTITVAGVQGNLTATCSNWNFDLATKTSGDIVVLINWTALANHMTSGITAQSVAAVVAPKLFQGQNGQSALTELPIHLIGHSRGGAMVYEIARLLGLQGIEIEHVTSLDPHPLTVADFQGFDYPLGPGQTIDVPVKVYENILFADSYYQNINYPTGEYVSGAYNRLWNALPGGYRNEVGFTYNFLGVNYDFSDHMNMILLYHGTVDLTTPVTNGEATMTTVERGWYNAYEDGGENIGFKYSRQLLGNRKGTDIPNGGDPIVAGYHNNALLGGNGPRQPITWTNAVWPNMIGANVKRNNISLSAGSQLIGTNEVLQLGYLYRSYTNASTVSFYVDIDRNPYNNNNVATIGSANHPATNNVISQSTIAWNTSGLIIGSKYYVYACITDGTRKRYQYMDYEFTIDPTASISTETQTHILIYPNPVCNELVLQNDGNSAMMQFEILNATGQVVYTGAFADKTTVSTTHFSKGVYMVKLQKGDGFECRKIVKE